MSDSEADSKETGSKETGSKETDSKETDSKETDLYEGMTIIIKSQGDGATWFDKISDFITQDCEGSEETPCTCGLESMGGTSGSFGQVCDWSTTIGSGLQPINLAKGIIDLSERNFGLSTDLSTETQKVIEWAKKEIEFEEWFMGLKKED